MLGVTAAINELDSNIGKTNLLSESNVVASINAINGEWETTGSNVRPSTGQTVSLRDRLLTGIKDMITSTDVFRIDGTTSNTVIISGSSHPTNFGTNGYVLTTDGNGVLTWESPSAAISSSILWKTDGGSAILKVADTVNMQSEKILGVATPTLDTDAATKGYVDGITYSESFVDANLSATGLIMIKHDLGQKIILTQVYNNSDTLIIPDSIVCSNTTTTTIDLNGYGAISGTWNVIIKK